MGFAHFLNEHVLAPLGVRVTRDSAVKLGDSAPQEKSIMFRAGFILFVLGLLICSTPAGAHARLDHASPAAGSTVSSPSEVTLYFTEQLEPKFSGAEVRNADGERVDRGSSISGKVMHRLYRRCGCRLRAWHDPASPGRHRDGQGRAQIRHGPRAPQAGTGYHRGSGDRDGDDADLAQGPWQMTPTLWLLTPVLAKMA